MPFARAARTGHHVGIEDAHTAYHVGRSHHVQDAPRFRSAAGDGTRGRHELSGVRHMGRGQRAPKVARPALGNRQLVLAVMANLTS